MRGSSKLAVLLLALIFFSTFSSAQRFGMPGGDPAIHGVPPSVTSFGFGGHPGFHGVPPSVTSLGFGSRPGQTHFGGFGFRNHRNNRFVNPFFGGGYYVPYVYPDYSYDVMDPGVDDSMEEEYAAPGPAAFDGSRIPPRAYERSQDDYRANLNRERPREEPAETEQEIQRPSPVAEPVQNQPNTVLVFKDGHQQEVGNYAIIGSTLYDLSNGHTKKVALAELDVAATMKQNDERGVEFKLPVVARN